MKRPRQFGNPEIRLLLWWFCRGCSHLTYCGDNVTCVWCGSKETGLGTGGFSWGESGLGSRGEKPQPEVVEQINYPIGVRLVKGFNLLDGKGNL